MTVVTLIAEKSPNKSLKYMNIGFKYTRNRMEQLTKIVSIILANNLHLDKFSLYLYLLKGISLDLICADI